MKPENRDILLHLIDRHRELGIAEQIDYDKFYLYSIIVHSTAIEGSTVTEVEAQLLFTIFQNCMASLHIQHLKSDIDQYLNSTIDNTTPKETNTTQKPLSATQKAILDYLKEHPQATRQEVAEALGDITEDGIKYHFSRLQKMGYLKREGGRKLGHWVVTF